MHISPVMFNQAKCHSEKTFENKFVSQCYFDFRGQNVVTFFIFQSFQSFLMSLRVQVDGAISSFMISKKASNGSVKNIWCGYASKIDTHLTTRAFSYRAVIKIWEFT